MRLLAPLVFCVAMTGSAADAATLTVTQQNPGNIFADAAGNNAWHASGSVIYHGQSRTPIAGLFRLTGDDGVGPAFDFEAFCIELGQYYANGSVYGAAPLRDAAVYGRIDALFSNAYAGVVDALTAAAFQFAIWEIATDRVLDLGAGDFQLAGSSTAGAVRLAASHVANIAAGVWTGSGGAYDLLAHPGSQDLVRLGAGISADPASAVPLPPSLLLLLGGLAGLGVLKRRGRAG
ncbi:hypothetical protein LNKW23_14400 [Paralimibaculum aggregatum]|uniref:VPLPA-CTERM sorting domain-containing protein n=1 Tax=Paralimibaculum aggregatum TaxID=3036245 RepID=A0ABQ6LGU3_9RHOB|nr:hypothetical protein [Limibaculum sp. NKW23]GMG82227.1 hypothetical protein LNKW23_14400 [Limibaculum sp. NKW23]